MGLEKIAFPGNVYKDSNIKQPGQNNSKYFQLYNKGHVLKLLIKKKENHIYVRYLHPSANRGYCSAFSTPGFTGIAM